MCGAKNTFIVYHARIIIKGGKLFMKQLNKNGIRVLKTLHYAAAGCWIGGAIVLMVFNSNNDVAVLEGMLPGINTALILADIWVLVPGAVGCLITGFAFSLFTPWGFFRHRWLTFKWLLTVACILIGAFILGIWEGEMLSISLTLGNAALGDSTYLATKSKHLVVCAAQIIALLLMIGVSVFKPWKRKPL